MRTIIYTVIATSLIFMIMVACQQEIKQTEQQKQAQITKIMKDSSKVNIMMDQIASDYHLQKTMMQKMIQHAKSDREAMTQIGKMMTDDMELRSMMQELTGETMMNKDSMMMHDMMEKK